MNGILDSLESRPRRADEAERKLWCHVIEQACAEARSGLPASREFFESEVFVTVTSLMGLDPDLIRRGVGTMSEKTQIKTNVADLDIQGV